MTGNTTPTPTPAPAPAPPAPASAPTPAPAPVYTAEHPEFPKLLYNQTTREEKAAKDKDDETKLSAKGFGEEPLPPDPNELTDADKAQLKQLLKVFEASASALAKLAAEDSASGGASTANTSAAGGAAAGKPAAEDSGSGGGSTANTSAAGGSAAPKPGNKGTHHGA